ncbi:MAG: polyphosphate:AMP phosphotransferase [Candidatus Palauibacterales bacterium]|nr:polyphosphate:AMP phosphotransferase [Candidatus Palauibacterales bacterium]MDP2483220.1 polyphosphate:AMP phosphotransferase [Candidatus Palauibacterales bacterium]
MNARRATPPDSIGVPSLEDAHLLFEAAETGAAVSRAQYRKRANVLRQELLEAQADLREARVPVIVMFAGVDGAGKGELTNLLNEWMDPRGITTRAFGEPTAPEAARPKYWRFWRDLPPRGDIGLFLSAWYTDPLLERVYGETSDAALDAQLDEINAFERTLANDGYLFLKFWMHLGREAQKERFEQLESDPLQSWRVTRKDWEHWTMYDRFIRYSGHIIRRTDTEWAPWRIVEGADANYRSLTVGEALRDRITTRLAGEIASARTEPDEDDERLVDGGENEPREVRPVTVLSALDMERSLEKKAYRAEVTRLQARLNRLYRVARDRGRSTILVFEGWDAAGKGGAIRRITPALDSRDYEIVSVAAPSGEENDHHYMWRFWRRLPGAGRFLIFDRSWYGRVLVERVERLATEEEWLRAYAEINDFEAQLVAHGSIVVKFWIHITPDEQDRRFQAREETPYKRWKLTDEDWRNRERWQAYEVAVDDMVRLTGTPLAPWYLVEGNDKRYARVRVLDMLCDAMDRALDHPLRDYNGIQMARTDL